MEWFSSGTALIEGLKWPLTVVFLAFFLKGPINGVISRIERISHNGTTIDVASVPTLGDRNVDPVVVDARTENAVLSAPRAAMIESWLRLELAVADVLGRELSNIPPVVARRYDICVICGAPG